MPKLSLTRLLRDVEACTICEEHLEHGVRPVVRARPGARVLIAGQAPGRRVHETGIPFNDPSGDRLRDWMGVTRDEFYDARKIAIVPMGFCFPGTGKGGDLPPRKECAEAWRAPLLERLPKVELTLVIGRYAHEWHLDDPPKTVTATVQAWRDWAPEAIPLPHPSPRNIRWLAKNRWFEEEVLPVVKERVRELIGG